MTQLTMENAKRHEIPSSDALYPDLLKQIESPPDKLYVLGSPESLKAGLAIVGARKATPYGIACAQRFAAIAAQLGITVVSGGAIGCDQAAHKGALDAGGSTVVVLGSGANIAYPKRGKSLFDRVLDSGGALVSELDWDTSPQKWAFRKRNRIIAGLSRAVLIVEAGLPSGTFSTADFALDAGRDVLVVPGSIFSDESKGSNTLLSQGATPVIDDESFLEALGRIFAAGDSSQDRVTEGGEEHCGRCGDGTGALKFGFELTAVQARIMDMLAASPMTADQVIKSLGTAPLDTMKELSLLEARKLVVRYPDGRFGIDPSAAVVA